MGYCCRRRRGPRHARGDPTQSDGLSSQATLNAVARRLNERPRKTLNFDTPAERFHQYVALAG
ncbi:hypothetical protein F7R11_01765 [Ralstonia insidiosa]|nr:hypothetical protein F7R11_01765 [Ralstonia insidiosa]